MIKIVVADHSPAARAAIVGLIESDRQMRVAGVAKTGPEALALTQRLRPDLIVMGLDICTSDDFKAGQEIMIEAPTPIVLLVQAGEKMPPSRSIFDLCGGAVAMLQLPAIDAPDREQTNQALLARLKAMAQVKVVRQWRRNARSAPAAAVASEDSSVGIVAIAASTGGPAALRQILGELPADFPVPILIVQHVANGFARNIATWLDSVCPLHVTLAIDREHVRPGTAYLASDDHHLGLTNRSKLLLGREPPIDGFRPSASYLFRSVAEHFGASTLALILTGMGRDGVDGLHHVKRAGGRVIAQDEATSVVFGMPGVAISEGVVDAVLPIEQIALSLIDLTRTDSAGAAGGQNSRC